MPRSRPDARRARTLVGACAGFALALGACSTGGENGDDRPAASEPTTHEPTPQPTADRPTVAASPGGGGELPRLDDWEVGASPLPERPDGFGQVRRTPRELRVRLMPTRDVLPPPPDARFRAEVLPLDRAYVRRTDLAWSPGCPVGLGRLRLLHLTFWGFDQRPHTGRMVVHASVARDVVSVFRRLHAARFPIEQMELVTQADLDAPPTGDGNNTAAYACRAAVGTTRWSAHARGLAIDVNPFMNPYQRGDLVLPELASAYLDRDWRRPGMIRPDGVVVRAFRDIGWTWGGTFTSVTDLHHFSATGD